MFWTNDKSFDRWKTWPISAEWTFWEWPAAEADKGNAIHLYKVTLYTCIVRTGDL